jgi:hypothetical protein
VAPPPPDGSRGCVATIRRLMQGVGHIMPCNTSRQAALQAAGAAKSRGNDLLARRVALAARCHSLS